MTNLLALSNLENGLFTFILGLVIIFGGMLIIVLAVQGAGKIISSKTKESNKVERKPEPVPVVAPVVEPVVEEGVPEHVRVAIIAAIAAYYENNNQPKNEFRVRKIKKLNNK